jgi:hypothetical protein
MTKTSAGSSPYPDDEDINLDEIPEFDFSNAVRGTYVEWAKRANGHFYEVTDEEDAMRSTAERQPKGLLKRLSRPKL